MAIAFDTSVNQQTNGGGSTLTFAFTTTGTNRYLVVGAIIQGGATITDVSYGGVSMTQIASQSSANVSAGETSYLFGLANPASGSNNVVITGSGAATIAAVASSYTGAQQTDSSEASNTASGASGAVTVGVTTLTNNAWLVSFVRGQSALSASAGTTLRTTSGGLVMCDKGADLTPAGLYSVDLTTASNNNWAILAASLKPFGAGESQQALSLLGVGS